MPTNMPISDVDYALLKAKVERAARSLERVEIYLGEDCAEAAILALNRAQRHIEQTRERIEFLVCQHQRECGL